MTTVETVAAAESVTAMAPHASAVNATGQTSQDHTSFSTQWLLLRATLRGRDRGGKSKRHSAHKTTLDEISFHDWTPFADLYSRLLNERAIIQCCEGSGDCRGQPVVFVSWSHSARTASTVPAA
jgi:hypothetical protein